VIVLYFLYLVACGGKKLARNVKEILERACISEGDRARLWLKGELAGVVKLLVDLLHMLYLKSWFTEECFVFRAKHLIAGGARRDYRLDAQGLEILGVLLGIRAHVDKMPVVNEKEATAPFTLYGTRVMPQALRIFIVSWAIETFLSAISIPP
jgi:hypothetical protein